MQHEEQALGCLAHCKPRVSGKQQAAPDWLITGLWPRRCQAQSVSLGGVARAELAGALALSLVTELLGATRGR